MKLEPTPRLRQCQSLTECTSLRVLSMPILELSAWLFEQIEMNPMISLDIIDPTYYARRRPQKSDRITQTVPFVEERDLFAHLASQLAEKISDPQELSQALTQLDELDDKGFLPSLTPNSPCLSLIQSLDPIGIGARSFQERLLLQLKNKQHYSKTSISILEDHYEDFIHRRFTKLCRKLHCSKERLHHLIHSEIASLSLNPLHAFQKKSIHPWTPDLFIREEEGLFSLEVNHSVLPVIMIDANYTHAAFAPSYFKEKKKEALFLQKIIAHRKATLFKLGKLILSKELDFFLGITNTCKGLAMEEAAEILCVHHSTISRAATKKVVSTPCGIFPLSYFFRNPMALPKTIETEIIRMIKHEGKITPLSAREIACRLRAKGIRVSRRSVSKYKKKLFD